MARRRWFAACSWALPRSWPALVAMTTDPARRRPAERQAEKRGARLHPVTGTCLSEEPGTDGNLCSESHVAIFDYSANGDFGMGIEWSEGPGGAPGLKDMYASFYWSKRDGMYALDDVLAGRERHSNLPPPRHQLGRADVRLPVARLLVGRWPHRVGANRRRRLLHRASRHSVAAPRP